MKLRKVIIASGKSFRVPQGIQRIDSSSTHGWQVRYAGTKLFSDGTYEASPSAALTAATQELLRRIARNPAPVRLLQAPSSHKSSRLPPGISGPIVQAGSSARGRSAHFSVLLPRFGQVAQVRKVHIASESVYNLTRVRRALAKAVALRTEAEVTYRAAATKAKREEAAKLRQRLLKRAA